MKTIPWIVLSLAFAVVGVLLNYEAVELRKALEEYEANEVMRQMDECERCKRNEESNWMWAAQERLDQLAVCEADNAACESALEWMERFWHPAHITPHTEEKCANYRYWADRPVPGGGR
jgi:hypothetical protein